MVTALQLAEVTRQQIWSATATAGENSLAGSRSSSDSSLSEHMFDSRLTLSRLLTERLPQALVNRWTLVAGGNEYQFANAHTPSPANSRNKQFTWINANLSWSVGDPISVSIKEEQNVDASGTVVILGKPYVGQTLTAGTSGIEDPNGVPNRFSYQWKAGNADIPGATGSTYTLQRADKGKTVKVEVSFTDDAGYEESLTSGATPAVGEADPRGLDGQDDRGNRP